MTSRTFAPAPLDAGLSLQVGPSAFRRRRLLLRRVLLASLRSSSLIFLAPALPVVLGRHLHHHGPRSVWSARMAQQRLAAVGMSLPRPPLTLPLPVRLNLRVVGLVLPSVGMMLLLRLLLLMRSRARHANGETLLPRPQALSIY